MFWKIQNGKIWTKRLEINVVHHCNMSCRGCSHLSPLLPDFFLSPDTLSGDLSILSKYCRPERVSLLGGEPLLHPNLLEILKVVRGSGITSRIRVVTNGLLLHRMPDQFWSSVDEVHVSLYPTHTMNAKILSAFRAKAKSNAVAFRLRYEDFFSELFFEKGNGDDSLVRRIYQTCDYARDACCHTLENGYYYKCPMAVFIPLAHKDRTDLVNAKDGIDIRGSGNLADELARYFEMEIPLTGCRYCLGSVGKRFTPQQVSRPDQLWNIPCEELIDWHRLERLEKRRGLPLPAWFPNAWQGMNNLIDRLPSSVLLSARFRRSIAALNEMGRKHVRHPAPE